MFLFVKACGSVRGVFPSNFVQTDVKAALQTLDKTAAPAPLQIGVSEIQMQASIGAGGFGKVYKAEWRGEVVAVKGTSSDILFDHRSYNYL